jgi:transposase
MAPLRGWGRKGQRLRAYAPHGHWRTLTFLGALRCDRLTAPCVFDGPINGQSFRAWVEQQLVPTLKPGDIVILDNLASHKSAALRQIIRTAGARLWFLPPYSPDLNPIEQTFAKIKHWMRTAQKRSITDSRKRRICFRQNLKHSSVDVRRAATEGRFDAYEGETLRQLADPERKSIVDAWLAHNLKLDPHAEQRQAEVFVSQVTITPRTLTPIFVNASTRIAAGDGRPKRGTFGQSPLPTRTAARS